MTTKETKAIIIQNFIDHVAFQLDSETLNQIKWELEAQLQLEQVRPKEKIKEICNKLNREQISVQGATEQLFDLYNVVRQSEQYCDCKVKGSFDTETLHRCRKCNKEMI